MINPLPLELEFQCDRVVHVDNFKPPTSERLRDRDCLARHRRLWLARDELVGGRSLEPGSIEHENRRREGLHRCAIGVRNKNHCARSRLPIEAACANASRAVRIVEPNPHSPHPWQKMKVHFVELSGEEHLILNQTLVRMIVTKGPIVGPPEPSRFEAITVAGLTDLVERIGHGNRL